MSKLFVVRHAEPAVTGVVLGQADPPLSDSGRREAREKLGALDVRIVYTSPLRRCLETAQVLAATPVIIEELAEISFGEWDGLSWASIRERYPELAEEKARDWFGVTPPGGETWDHFTVRVAGALRQISHGPAPAAVIGHVAANSVIAREMTGADPLKFNQGYCEIHEYEFKTEAKD